ncbi:MAG: NTP transferase domain-containing protein [Candidatus Lokiarchaeota archaeon]|nr:NTP transferase domain-containing protein [Candidatus Lokiarchaeota archaeon]
MKVTAIIMAGGKGSRFDYKKAQFPHQEKLLLKLGSRVIIERVADALKKVRKINKIIFAVSPNSPKTKQLIYKKYSKNKIIDTSGIGYHEDLQEVFRKENLATTLIINGDIPLIKPEIIDEIIEIYVKLNKPALSVMAKANCFALHNLTPTSLLKSEQNKCSLVPLGINMINGNYIKDQEIEQAIYITNRIELFYNINTFDDYMELLSFFDDQKN